MKKTDNHFLGDKIRLRIDRSPFRHGHALRVLDCFGGKGLVWFGVERISGFPVDRIAIDIRKDITSFHLHGDNVKILSGMDLDHFDVIDLDAYGIPVDQLDIIFRKGYIGTVFVTAIQTMHGALPHAMLTEVGFTKTMLEKAPALPSRRGFQYLLEWLALRGIKTVWHRSHNRKHYMAFRMGDETDQPAAGCNSHLADTSADPFLCSA